MVILQLTLLFLCVLLSGVLAQDQCQILQADSEIECTLLENCTGMTCSAPTNGSEGIPVTFVVRECTDPLVVSVSVSGSTVEFSPTAVGEQNLTAGGLTIRFNVSRNASTAWIQASLDNGSEIFPLQVFVPLNQRDCMCESITAIASTLSMDSTIETGCLVNRQCSGIDCAVVLLTTFYIEADVQPCEKPPGILLGVRSANFEPIYEGYFNSSRNVLVPLTTGSALPPLPVNVIITHHDYSMEVEILGTVPIGIQLDQFTIVSLSQIIIDVTRCSAAAADLEPAPPPEAVSGSTCDIVRGLADDSQGNFLECSAGEECDRLTCSLGNYYTTVVQVLSCSDPARFYVKVTRLDTLVFSGIVTEMTSMDLESYGELRIEIVDYIDEVSIEVDLYTGFFNLPTPLSPLLRVPKDYCLCSVANCPTTMPTTAASPTTATESSSNGNSSATVVAITVPIIFLVLIVALVLAGIIALLLWMQRKAQFSFQQLESNKQATSMDTFRNTSKAADNEYEPAN